MGLGSGIRDQGSGKNLLRIPDPGSRGQKGTGSRTLARIRNTGINEENEGRQANYTNGDYVEVLSEYLYINRCV
jgi:hypothetical protein